jgi:hypothetical protein
MNITEKMVEALAKPNQDIFGNRIVVGSKVRSFDHSMISNEGIILGMETEMTEKNRVQYIEGVVEAIGEEWVEGCKRYTIRVTKEVCYAYGKDYGSRFSEGNMIHPPLNGTPSMFGSVCFGVVAI